LATDQYTGNGSATQFALSDTPADANSLVVTVNGVTQAAPTNYTTSGNIITFTSAPLAGANVVIRNLGFRTTSTLYALSAGTPIVQPQITGGTINLASSVSTTNGFNVYDSTGTQLKAGINANNVFSTGNLVMQAVNSIQLQSGSNTATMPAAAGTVMVSGNMPAFSAYQSSAQTITGGSFTKVTCQTKEFDTNSNYDNATNYRFTPTVAGYYQFNAALQVTTSTSTGLICFYKNGAEVKRPTYLSGSSVVNSTGGSALIYCNGSTDYIEFYALLGTGQALSTNVFSTWFQGVMVRSAWWLYMKKLFLFILNWLLMNLYLEQFVCKTIQTEKAITLLNGNTLH